MIILGGGLTFLFYHARSDQIVKLLQANNKAIGSLVETAFTDASHTVSFLAEQDSIRNYSQKTLSRSQQDKRRDLIELYSSIKKTNNRIRYLYSAYEHGREIIIDDWRPPEAYDPVSRPWYQAALTSFPRVSTGLQYRDVIDGEWYINTSKVLIDHDGAFVGVVALDMNLDVIEALIEKKPDDDNLFYSYIIASNGQFIFHPDSSLIGNNIFSYVPDFSEHTFKRPEASISYRYQDKDRIGYYSHIPGTNWIVATAINKYDIFWQYFWQAGLCFTIVIITAISWALWQSKNTLAKIIHPLQQLEDQMECVTRGQADTHHWVYPDNEIGHIAKSAAKLAEKELVAKNAVLNALNDKLEAANQALEQEKLNFQRMSNTDQLTHINNRRSLDRALIHEYSRSRRYKHPLTMLMVDVDKFKEINDTLGHLAGDRILVEIANVLKSNIRETDIVGRWGGEEFMVICPDTNLQGGITIAEKIRSKIREHQFISDTKITVSIGVSEMTSDQNIDSLIQSVDVKLYQAKHQGRDQVISTYSMPEKAVASPE